MDVSTMSLMTVYHFHSPGCVLGHRPGHGDIKRGLQGRRYECLPFFLFSLLFMSTSRGLGYKWTRARLGTGKSCPVAFFWIWR